VTFDAIRGVLSGVEAEMTATDAAVTLDLIANWTTKGPLRALAIGVLPEVEVTATDTAVALDPIANHSWMTKGPLRALAMPLGREDTIDRHRTAGCPSLEREVSTTMNLPLDTSRDLAMDLYRDRMMCVEVQVSPAIKCIAPKLTRIEIESI
jgi:hypothetical protein